MALSEARKLFYAAPLNGYVLNDKLYGIPHEFNLDNGGALVNKAMFEADQIKYLPAWTNWDEVVADAQKLVRMDSD